MNTQCEDKGQQLNVGHESSQPHVVAVTVDWWLVRISEFVVVASLVGLVAALAGMFYAPQVLLISLLLTGTYAYMGRKRTSGLPGLAPHWTHLLLLLLVALIFRVPAYHYVLGGQDEGLYVNIAHYIEKTGGINVHDDLRTQLEGTPYLSQYLAENHLGGSYVAGVYKGDEGAYKKSGKLTFQFYDVFPVWMALFVGIFGSVAGVYALTFLSLLSIALFYRIALLISGSHKAALAAGGLLALNPLHAFFSKFPVTEVPMLCLALIGFTLLAAYWSALGERRQGRWLLFSVLAFLSAFMTRISGFMYVPFFIALAWASLLFDADRNRSRAIQWWSVGTVVAYLISVLYGFIWSRPYSEDIYRGSFAPLLGEHWRMVLGGAGAMVAGLWITIAALSRNERMRLAVRAWLVPLTRWGASALIWATLLLGIIKIYKLGWTQKYLADGWLGARWHLADAGWHSVTASSLWTWLVFTGPFLVPAFVAMSTRKRREPMLVFMHWFVAGFFAYALLLQWVIPYSPYYARYLLSELLPYTILFVVCAWCGLRAGAGRLLLSSSLVLSLLYAGALSAAQIGKNECDGAYSALKRIMAPVGPSDLTLLDRSSFNQSEIKTPLLYTFDRQAVTVNSRNINSAGYLAKLDALYGSIFLLTEKAHVPAGFTRVRSVRLEVMHYVHNNSFPHRLHTWYDTRLQLYRLNSVPLPLGTPISFARSGAGTRWLLSGWSHPEKWGTWSVGNRAAISLDPQSLPKANRGVSLTVNAHAYVTRNHPIQHIAVFVDNRKAGSYVVRYPERHVVIVVPIDADKIRARRQLTVAFRLPDAISPKTLGRGGDSRDLALGLDSATIKLAHPTEASQAGARH